MSEEYNVIMRVPLCTQSLQETKNYSSFNNIHTKHISKHREYKTTGRSYSGLFGYESDILIA